MTSAMERVANVAFHASLGNCAGRGVDDLSRWSDIEGCGEAADGADGVEPSAAVVFDRAGNLYATTFDGGANVGQNFYNGTVYKLTPETGGGWTETILHSFGAGTDGGAPEYSVIFDSSGNLYGTTLGGGTGGEGTVWEITP